MWVGRRFMYILIVVAHLLLLVGLVKNNWGSVWERRCE